MCFYFSYISVGSIDNGKWPLKFAGFFAVGSIDNGKLPPQKCSVISVGRVNNGKLSLKAADASSPSKKAPVPSSHSLATTGPSLGYATNGNSSYISGIVCLLSEYCN